MSNSNKQFATGKISASKIQYEFSQGVWTVRFIGDNPSCEFDSDNLDNFRNSWKQ